MGREERESSLPLPPPAPQDCPTLLDGDRGELLLRRNEDAEALADRLGAMAARRRVEHDRETRFLRLQVLSLSLSLCLSLCLSLSLLLPITLRPCLLPPFHPAFLLRPSLAFRPGLPGFSLTLRHTLSVSLSLSL